MSADTFGQWLKGQAVARFGTLRAFAAAIGKEPTYISRWVNDHERPSYESARLIADLLDVPIAEVLARAGMPIHAEEGAIPPTPSEVTVNTRYGAITFDRAKAIAYVEAKPDPIFQEQLARAKQQRGKAAYERWLLKIYVAWSSNADLAVDSLDLHDVENGA